MKPLFLKSRQAAHIPLLIAACLIAFALFLSEFRPFIIVSPSMTPEYPVYSVVLIKQSGFTALKPGDVIAYQSAAMGGRLAMHRITRKESGGYYVKGDMNAFEDNQLITKDLYAGKSVFKITLFARGIAAARRAPGFICYILLPLSALILLTLSLTFYKKSGERR